MLAKTNTQQQYTCRQNSQVICRPAECGGSPAEDNQSGSLFHHKIRSSSTIK